MIQTNYALSYNVKNQAIDILSSIRSFDTWKRVDDFIRWFNGVIEAKGRVLMTEICKKTKRDTIDQFERIGFNDKIRDNDIFEMTKIDGSEFYQVLFPVLKDFTQKGIWE